MIFSIGSHQEPNNTVVTTPVGHEHHTNNTTRKPKHHIKPQELSVTRQLPNNMASISIHNQMIYVLAFYQFIQDATVNNYITVQRVT